MGNMMGMMGGKGGGAPPMPDAKNFRQGDWFCPACGAHNFASKSQCFKCGMPKPPEFNNMPGMGGGGGGGGKGGWMGGPGKGLGQNMPDEAPKLFPSVYVSDIPRAWDTQTLQMMIDDDEVVQIKLLPSKLDSETCCAMVRFRSKESAEGAVNRLKGLPVTTAAGQAGTKYLGARIANAPAKLPGQRWAMAKRMMGHPAGWQGPSSSSSDSSSSSSSDSAERKKKKKKKKEKKEKKEK